MRPVSICLKTLVILSLSLPATGQWKSLAANYDGTQVYFVSSLRQAGTTQPEYGKVFLADSSGVRPLLIRNRDAIPSGIPQYDRTNAYDMIGVDVSSDVSRLAVVALSECHGTTFLCRNPDLASTTVYDSSGKGTNFEGRGRLSPNGQWISFVYLPVSGQGRPTTPASIFNLDTNRSTLYLEFYGPTYDYKNGTIANNGELAFASGSTGVHLLPFDGPSVDVGDKSASQARIDGAAATLVWVRRLDQRQVIMVSNAPAFTPCILFSAVGDSNNPSLSADGTEAAFLTTDSNGIAQAFQIGTDGTGLTQATSEPAGITDALLTADGHTLIAVSGDGSLLRFTLRTRQREQLIRPTLSLTSSSFPGIGGQVVHLTGTNLESAGVQVNSVNVPVLRSAPTFLDFQVPWQADLSFNSVPIAVTPAASPSGWLDAAQFRLQASNGALTSTIHQDFSGLITTASPAYPGEIVHLYATGLGPVLNPPPTGQPAPASPLSPLVKPLDMTLMDSTGFIVSPEILFAGLAPGTVGYYQVSFRVPSTWIGGVSYLQSPLLGQGYSMLQVAR